MLVTKALKNETITLQEIEAALNVPYNDSIRSIIQNRYKELQSMTGDEPHYALLKYNLKFLNRLVFAVISMNKNKNVYESFNYFSNQYLERNFTEQELFYWNELKSILFFATYFKNVKNYGEFKNKILKKSFHLTLSKYKTTDGINKDRYIKAKEYYNLNSNKQLAIHF